MFYLSEKIWCDTNLAKWADDELGYHNKWCYGQLPNLWPLFRFYYLWSIEIFVMDYTKIPWYDTTQRCQVKEGKSKWTAFVVYNFYYSIIFIFKQSCDKCFYFIDAGCFLDFVNAYKGEKSRIITLSRMKNNLNFFGEFLADSFMWFGFIITHAQIK